METIECGQCGIVFAVPVHWYNEKRNTGGGWHCPNGHPRVFKEPRVDVLRRERDRLKQRLAEKDDQIQTEQKRTAAFKGEVTKLKRRAKAGMCPCCKRSFVNLQRHMATKHPDMNPEEPLKVIEGGKV